MGPQCLRSDPKDRPHSVASYDTQRGGGGSILTRILMGLSCEEVYLHFHQTEWGPVRIRARIGPLHPHASRKRRLNSHLTSRKKRLNGTVLQMKLEKLSPRVTAGVAR
jgi:hypothetical protein